MVQLLAFVWLHVVSTVILLESVNIVSALLAKLELSLLYKMVLFLLFHSLSYMHTHTHTQKCLQALNTSRFPRGCFMEEMTLSCQSTPHSK